MGAVNCCHSGGNSCPAVNRIRFLVSILFYIHFCQPPYYFVSHKKIHFLSLFFLLLMLITFLKTDAKIPRKQTFQSVSAGLFCHAARLKMGTKKDTPDVSCKAHSATVFTKGSGSRHKDTGILSGFLLRSAVFCFRGKLPFLPITYTTLLLIFFHKNYFFHHT